MRTIIIVGLVAIIWSCKPEEETSLRIRYINGTTETIKLDKSYVDPTIENIFPGGENSSMRSHRGASNSFPIRLFYFPGDSFIVYFADTLRIVHVGPWLSLDSTLFQEREEIILYDDPRNLYNLDSYEKSRLKDNIYEAKYTFTQEDFEYAISVYE